MTRTQPIHFGKYLLLDRIAVGATAEWYQATTAGSQGPENLVTIKKILPHLSEEEDAVQSLLQEAKIAELLHHHNIVRVQDSGSVEGSCFMAMEYVRGEDLATVIRKSKQVEEPLSLEYALSISSHICAALDYAHKLKGPQEEPYHIVHGDLRPQNILVSFEGEIKLVGFGISGTAVPNNPPRTAMPEEKAAYMSPEQADGKNIDHRSDIFSAGIILYEAVFGERMFQGDTQNVLAALSQAEFSPSELLMRDLPPKLHEILQLALARKPGQRYQAAGEMFADLEACLFQQGLAPSTRELAHYMRTLFAEDRVAEEELVHEQAEPDALPGSEAEREAAPAEKDPEGTDLIAVGEPPLKRKGLGLLFGALSAVAVIIALFFAMGSKQDSDPLPSSGKDEMLTSSKHRSGANSKEATSTDASQKEQGERTASLTGPPSSQKSSPEFDDLSRARLESATRALQEGRYREAVKTFEELLHLRPTLTAKVSVQYAQALLGQASNLLEEDPPRAEGLLLKAADLDPGNPQVHIQLGALYVNLEEYPKAIESYEKVAGLDPESPDAFFNLGYVYAKTRDYATAERMYSRAVALAPAYLDEALFNLAMVQLKLGKKHQCIKNLEQAFAINPGNKQAKAYLQRLKTEQ